jgi:hypothetical protein
MGITYFLLFVTVDLIAIIYELDGCQAKVSEIGSRLQETRLNYTATGM